MFQNRNEALLLALPAAVFAAVIFLVPVVILLSESFRSPAGWSLAPHWIFFSEPLNQTVFWRTLKLGLQVTAVSAVIGLPTLGLTLALARADGLIRGPL